jgi:MFS family permease
MHARWLVLAVLTFARTAMGFQFQSVAVVSPQLHDAFALSYAAIGTLIGLYLLPGSAVAMPGGMLAQRFGDKGMACAGLAAMTAGGMLLGAAEDSALLTIGRLLSGSGAVLLNVVLTKMVTDWFQDRGVAKALGILITSWPLGIAIALVVLPPVVAAYSWAAAMHAAAAVCGVSLLLVAAIYKPPPLPAAPPATGPAYGLRLGLPPRELALTLLAGVMWAFYNVAFILVLAFGPELLTASGSAPAAANALVSLVSWIIIPALPLGAWLAERTRRPDATIFASLAVAAAAIAALALAGPAVAVLAAIGLGFGPPGGLIMALPGEAAPPERRAVAMGLFFTCYYAGMGVLPALAGLARDLSGDPAAPLWVAAAMLAATMASLLPFRLLQGRAAAASRSV